MEGPGSRPGSVPRDSATSALRRRRRPALACQNCRARKIKCDRRAPCNKCIRGKRAQSCAYVADGAPAVPNSRPSCPAPVPAKEPLTPQSRDGPVVQAVGSSNRTKLIEAGPLQDVAGRFVSHARPNATGESTAAQTQPSVALAPSPDVPLKETYVKGQLFGASHWTNTVDHLPTMFRFEQLNHARYPHIRELLRKCKQNARKARKHLASFEASVSKLREKVPPRNVADQLFHRYLQTFETVFRLHHVPSFRRDYEEYWSDSASAKDGFIVKLLLVLALGTSFDNLDDNESWYSASLQWVVAAHAWAHSPFCKRRGSLVGVQIQCLLLLARQTHGVGGDTIWISAGTLLRTAMQLGLNRDPSHLPVSSSLEIEVRKRVWATTLELLTQASIDAGQPPLVSVDDFDCGPPSAADDFEMDANPCPQDHEVVTHRSPQNDLLESLPVRLEITKFLNHFRSDLSYSTALELSARLTKSMRIPPILSQGSSESQLFQRKMLEFLTHRFLIVLHQGFAAKARSSPTFYFSRKMCLDASLLILNFEQPAPKSMYFTKLMSLGNGIFHTTLLQAASYIIIEQVFQQEEASSFPSLVTQSSLLSRQEQRQALRLYGDRLRETLKRGRANFKGYVLLECAILQLDDTRSSSEEEKVSRLEKVLQDCADILAQASGTTETHPDQQETPGQHSSELGEFEFDLSNFALDFGTPNVGALSSSLFSDPMFWPFQE